MNMLGLVFCQVLSCIGLIGAAVSNNRDVMGYLEENGYMGPEMTQRDSVMMFQRFTGLPMTGVVDQRSMEMMNKPRCGMPDIQVLAEFKTAPTKWIQKRLSYQIINRSPDLPRSVVDQVLAESFKIWSDVTSLRFNRVNTEDADLKIRFASGAHSNSQYDGAFDGRGNVLAHAFFPRDGRIHFDEDEDWTDKTLRGTNLLWVAVHEIGHALGLEHSEVTRAIMFPYYSGYNPNFHLHTDDIAGIRSLYGNNDDWMDTIRSRCFTPHRALKIVKDVTSLQACKDACKQEQSFGCLAVDYNEREKECRLSSTYHRNSRRRYCRGYVSTERKTGAFPWTDKRSACIIGHDDAIVDNAQCYQTCKVKCYEETSFVCLSFEFESAIKQCRLSRKNSSSASLMRPCPNRGVRYFERQQG
ncbi:unnamed protein product [Owenia fusiformis]|uniref:Apple domain-containing protein n=1 Tax=Owenia fusiformis TaxID=6347 RepID=A0A8S4PPG5_OWEFU|nr:unnamed protein product [Owenia fusiformis]